MSVVAMREGKRAMADETKPDAKSTNTGSGSSRGSKPADKDAGDRPVAGKHTRMNPQGGSGEDAESGSEKDAETSSGSGTDSAPPTTSETGSDLPKGSKPGTPSMVADPPQEGGGWQPTDYRDPSYVPRRFAVLAPEGGMMGYGVQWPDGWYAYRSLETDDDGKAAEPTTVQQQDLSGTLPQQFEWKWLD